MVCSPDGISLKITCLGQYQVSTLAIEEVYHISASGNTMYFKDRIQALFSVNNPTMDALPNCQVSGFSVYTDSAGTIPLSGDPILTLHDDSLINTARLEIVSTAPVNPKTVYVKGKSNFLTASDILKLDIYICGYETIVVTGSPSVTQTFNKGIGNQNIDITSIKSAFTSSDNMRCPVTTYSIVDSSYVALTGSQFTLSGNDIVVDTSTPFAGQLLYLKVGSLSSLNPGYAPLDIVVCGSEVIQEITPVSTVIQTFDLNTGLQTIDITGIKSQLRSSEPRCPITTYSLVDSSYAALTGSQFTLSGNNIVVDTSSTFSGQLLYIKVETQSGSTPHYIPLDILVCGVEVIQELSPQSQITKTYDLNSGVHKIDISGIQSQLQSSDPRCPINSYYVTDQNKNDFTPPFTQIQIVGSEIVVQTTNFFRDLLYMKVKTQSSPHFYYLPLDIMICGFEKIINTSPEELKIQKTYDLHQSISKISLDAQPQISNLQSTEPRCPIKGIYLRDNLGNAFSYPVMFNSPKLFTSTDQPFNKLLDLVAEVTAFQFKIPVDILVCGNEKIEQLVPLEFSLNYLLKMDEKIFAFGWIFPKLKLTETRCPITNYKIVDQNQNDYLDQYVQVDDSKLMTMKILTLKELSLSLYLKAETKSGSSSLIPFNITIQKNTTIEGMNFPPQFDGKLSFIEVKNLTAEYVLPEIFDPNDDYYCMKISCKTLGGTLVDYRNKTQLEKVSQDPLGEQKVVKEQEIFNFDENLRKLSIELKQETREQFLGTHILNIRLADLKGNTKDYLLSLIVVQNIDIPITNHNPEIEAPSKRTNVKARITDIDIYGNMTIKFSEPMRTQGLNLTKLNQSICDLYVIPFDDWIEDYDYFNMSTLNFTWNVTGYSSNLMSIKLYFNNPEVISPRIEPDRILFHILDPQIYFFSEKMEALDQAYHTLDYPLRRQLEPTSAIVNFFDSSEVSSSILLNSQIVIFLMNFLLSGLMNQMLSLINTFQLIFHMPLLMIIMPTNVINFFSIMLPIIKFDLFEQFGIIESLFEEPVANEFDNKDEVNIFSQMIYLGYETHNPIINLGTLSFFLLSYLIRLFCLFTIVSRLRKQNEYFKSFYASLKQQLIFSEFLLIGMEGVFEILIAAYLTFEEQSDNNSTFLIVVTWFMVAYSLVILPAMLIWFSSRDADQVKFEVLFEEIKTHETMQLLYHTVFYSRRVLFLIVCFYMSSKPYFQTMTMTYMNLSIMIYQGLFRPLKSRLRNYVENFNEFLLNICFVHLFLFTEYVPEAKTQYQCGWSLIFFIILFMLFHVFGVCYSIGCYLKLVYVKYSRRYCKKRSEDKPQIVKAETIAKVKAKTTAIVKAKTLKNSKTKKWKRSVIRVSKPLNTQSNAQLSEIEEEPTGNDQEIVRGYYGNTLGIIKNGQFISYDQEYDEHKQYALNIKANEMNIMDIRQETRPRYQHNNNPIEEMKIMDKIDNLRQETTPRYQHNFNPINMPRSIQHVSNYRSLRELRLELESKEQKQKEDHQQQEYQKQLNDLLDFSKFKQ